MRTPTVLVAVLVSLLPAAIAPAATLHLKSGPVDIQAEAAHSAVESAVIRGRGYYLVALKGPVTETAKRTLIDAGAEITEYIPDFAFLVSIEHSKAAQLRKLEPVEWVGPFRPEYKSAVRMDSDGKKEQFVVLLFSPREAGYVLSRARLMGAKSLTPSEGSALRLLATRDQVRELSKLAPVSWIEPYLQPKLCNNVAAGICGLPELRQGLGLFGAGQIVGVADAGLDTGNLSTISADFAGRIIRAYALRRPGDWSDLNGHGTHVVGSLLGSGALSGANPALHSYTDSFAGSAPEASLVFQSIGDAGDLVFPPLYLFELFQPTYEDGVRVHCDSWGSAAKGAYTIYSNQVDQFVWDHKDFTVVFPVGNDGEDRDQNGIVDPDSIYAPATAKNCIAAGATESLRSTGSCLTGYGFCWPSSFPAAPIKYDPVSNNPNGMAAFSGRGPTDDGRVKPDLCAPGTNIVSSRTHASPGATGWGIYDANYIYFGGTSMSVPQVAGAAALVREFHHREKGINASAALVKATLINGAEDISPGQYGSGSQREVFAVPDRSQGWGRLNVKRALFPDPPVVNEFTDESSPLSTGETREYHYTVVDNSVPLVATLVWSDYPGAVHAAIELVNDLDLTVVAPGGATYPQGSPDRINNVEQVRIASPELGTYKVRVTGYNVPMGPQDYALVVSGGLPNTYIAGTVTSSSGAGVPGALISIVSVGGTKRVTTNANGTYITHVGPGSYSVQVGKPGWTFAPRSRVVSVTSSPVEGVNFQGQGSPGNLTGHLTSVIGGVTSHIVESPHPYLNSFDKTYTITAHPDATRVRVHFAEIDLMADGDVVYVLDAYDGVVNTYTGRGEDIWSSWITGNVAKIRIVSNELGNIGYGFYSDGYETDLINQGSLAGATLTLTPGGYQATSGAEGTYTLSSIPPGTYTITPSKPHWKFQPASKTVEIPAGGSASGADFLGFPPGSIDGEVRTVTAQTQSINIQSPHPYPANYENTWQITGNPNATRIRVHFDYISTEPAWDWVYVMDGEDNIIEMYTAEHSDLWSPWIPGSVARIMLTSDEFNNYNGFRCDKYEQETAGGGLAGVSVSLLPGGQSTSTSAQGLFSFAEVDTGTHTVSPALPPWTFDPSTTGVSVSPGVAQHLLFYARIGDLTVPAQARLLGDGNQVTLKGVSVTARFNGFFYVQDSARTGGIRVVWPGTVTEGAVVDVTGTLATVDGERRISATSVTVQ
jgi:subtilisin family serine protease